MKILQVIEFFSPRHGGSVTVPYELSKQLRDAGHDVTVLTTDFQIDNDFINSLDGVEIIPFHCQANIGGFLVSTQMNKYLKQNIKKFDIIHLHNFRTYQNIVVYKFALKHKIPYILQAHGSVLPFFQKKRLKMIFDKLFGYNILNNSSKVIALNKIESEQYLRMEVNVDKIVTIPNGINLSDYNNLPKKGEFRKKYSIRKNERIILYLGRLHKIKGIDLLLDTFFELNKELNNIKLVIAGPDDGFLEILKKQTNDLNLNDKILFTGPLYGDNKLEAYVDADVYILPSVYEIFGITVLEACACGTPVIVTNRCGIAEFIENTGIVVKYNKNELKYATSTILSDNDLRERLGKKGRKLVIENFGWNKFVVEVEGIYEQCKKSR